MRNLKVNEMSFKPLSTNGSAWDAADLFDKPGEFGVKDLIIPVGSEKRVCFLTAEPFGVYRHSLFKYTKSGAREICLLHHGDGFCPMCESGDNPGYAGLFGVIDCGVVVRNASGAVVKLEGFTPTQGANAGKSYNFLVRIAAFSRGRRERPGTLPLLKSKAMRARCENVQFSIWDIGRLGGQSPSSGDDFNFVKKLTNVAEVRAELARYKCPKETIDKITAAFNMEASLVLPTAEHLARICNFDMNKAPTRRTSAPEPEIDAPPADGWSNGGVPLDQLDDLDAPSAGAVPDDGPVTLADAEGGEAFAAGLDDTEIPF